MKNARRIVLRGPPDMEVRPRVTIVRVHGTIPRSLMCGAADIAQIEKAHSAPSGWAFWNRSEGPLLDPRHVACLRTLLTVDNLELDLIAFLQALISIGVDRAVVHEYIRMTIVAADKAKAFRIIEPLHGPLQFHFRRPPGIAHQHPHPEDAGLELRQSGRAQKPRSR